MIDKIIFFHIFIQIRKCNYDVAIKRNRQGDIVYRRYDSGIALRIPQIEC